MSQLWSESTIVSTDQITTSFLFLLLLGYTKLMRQEVTAVLPCKTSEKFMWNSWALAACRKEGGRQRCRHRRKRRRGRRKRRVETGEGQPPVTGCSAKHRQQFLLMLMSSRHEMKPHCLYVCLWRRETERESRKKSFLLKRLRHRWKVKNIVTLFIKKVILMVSWYCQHNLIINLRVNLQI